MIGDIYDIEAEYELDAQYDECPEYKCPRCGDTINQYAQLCTHCWAQVLHDLRSLIADNFTEVEIEAIEEEFGLDISERT